MTKKEFLYETHKDIQGQGLKEIRVERAMEEYAKQEAIEYSNWKRKVVAMQDQQTKYIVNTYSGLDFNIPYTEDELYNAFLQSKKNNQ